MTTAQVIAFAAAMGLGAMPPAPVRAIRASLRRDGAVAQRFAGRVQTTAGKAFHSGLLCNVLNPKAAEPRRVSRGEPRKSRETA